MADHVSITRATRNDVSEILAMLFEYADFIQSDRSEIHATEQSLLDTLIFDDPDPSTTSTQPQQNRQGFARGLILRASGSPSSTSDSTSAQPLPSSVAGMALYYTTYTSWRAKPGVYLEDLYVRPAYRSRGYGKLLIRAVAKEALNMGGVRMQWTCMKWNEPSLRFYRALGAKELDDKVMLRVDGEALGKLAGT